MLSFTLLRPAIATTNLITVRLAAQYLINPSWATIVLFTTFAISGMIGFLIGLKDRRTRNSREGGWT
jgi:hypothetical protein